LAGVKRGEQVETALGIFCVNQQDLADGPVVMTIRPENLKLGEEGENTVRARVASYVYAGTHTRFKVEAGQQTFQVVADASSAERFREGNVGLTFPRAKIWLVPREE